MIKLICRRRKTSNLDLSVSHSTIIVDRFVLFQGYIRSWNLSPNSHARVGQIPEFGNNLLRLVYDYSLTGFERHLVWIPNSGADLWMWM